MSAVVPVSSESELLILVDEEDRVLGHETKAHCHDGAGLLHRAFSVFLFNERDEVLLQQRAAGKRLWPGFWANSCCSHPRQGEEIEAAAHRRVHEELGLSTHLTLLYRFIYRAEYRGLGTEHELCAVLVGTSNDAPRVHPQEVAAWRYVPSDALADEMQAAPDRFSPWLKLEWPEVLLRRTHGVGR